MVSNAVTHSPDTRIIAETNLDGGAERGSPPSPPPPPTSFFFFCNHLFFCDHFEELQTKFTEVKLIINNATLAYVYPNTIKTYLTPILLLFVRQLLCYSNTTSAVIRNVAVLSRTNDRINRFSNHFWHRWRHEYVVNLRQTQRASKLNINSKKLCCSSL